MPPTDEFKLRKTAQHLKTLYHQLHNQKYETPPGTEIKTPTPYTSTPPGNWIAIATWLDQNTRLQEVAFDAFNNINIKLRDEDVTPTRLCELIAYHANPIAALDWATDLQEELDNQVRIITRKTHTPTTAELANQPERRLPARQIRYRLAAQGHKVTIDQIRGWARSGHVTTQKDSMGRNRYLLTECLEHFYNTQ